MYTIELRLDTKGYDEYLEKKFKHGYKLKRALVNYFNMQENRRVNSDRYKELAGRILVNKEVLKSCSMRLMSLYCY